MTEETAQGRPLVSVVLATFNEVGHIQRCMTSLLAQETPDFDLEILAIDGMSTDGTRESLQGIAARDRRVRVLLNQRRRAPFAFNLGLREARGEFVCIFGSHTIYNKDYISVCLTELLSKGAVGCGGRVLTHPGSNRLQARLVAHAMAHPFGSSRKSFRTQEEGFADAVNYMVIRKEPVLEVGGYSEVLLRNQDNDLNQKLRSHGHRLFCTWKTRCIYHPKESLRDLFIYAYRNGFWNVISFEENSASMATHHFIPFLFVATILSTLLLALLAPLSPAGASLALPLFAVLFLHLGIGTAAAAQVAVRSRSLGALLLPGVFFGFHFAYGLGTLIAFVKGAKAPKSSFTSREASTG